MTAQACGHGGDVLGGQQDASVSICGDLVEQSFLFDDGEVAVGAMTSREMGVGDAVMEG